MANIAHYMNVPIGASRLPSPYRRTCLCRKDGYALSERKLLIVVTFVQKLSNIYRLVPCNTKY